MKALWKIKSDDPNILQREKTELLFITSYLKENKIILN